MRFLGINFQTDRIWAGIYGFVFVFFLAQALGVVFYENIISSRIESRLQDFEEEADLFFTKGDFDLEGFSGAAYLYENGVLRRWNNSEFIPPSVFLTESSDLDYLEVSKKYMVLYRVSRVNDNETIDLVLLLSLFQESPRGNPIIEDIFNQEIFFLGGIGPDSFEGEAREVKVRGQPLFKFSLHYKNLQLPLWTMILDTILLLLVWVGLRSAQRNTSAISSYRVVQALILEFLVFSMIFFLWLGISTSLLIPAIFISISAQLIRELRRLKKGENSFDLSRVQLIIGSILSSAFFIWFLNNWTEVNPSSYLGLNIGWDRAFISKFLAVASGLFCWTLMCTAFISSKGERRNFLTLGAIFLLSTIALFFVGNDQIWVWLVPPSIAFLIRGIMDRLPNQAVVLSMALLFVSASSQVTREISLGQRLSQFEKVIKTINRPDDSSIKDRLEKLQVDLEKDPLVRTSFRRSIGSFKTAERKILHHHLKNFKQFYDLDILFFDYQDRNLQPGKSTLDLSFYQSKLFRDKTGMVSPNLRIINNSMGNVQEFSVLTEFRSSGNKIGNVLILGERREGIGTGVGQVINSLEGLSLNYSYWPYSSFKISREKGLIWDDWVESEALKIELADSISSHFDMMGSLSFDKEGLFLRGVVFDDTGFGLAFPFPGALSFIGNLLIMLACFLLFLSGIYFFEFLGGGKFEIGWNLRTKMQFLYVLAIILPLGIFSFLLFWTQSSAFEEGLRSRDLLKAKNYYELTKEKFKEFLNGQVSRTKFVQYTRDQAEEKGLNISIYDQSGTMFYTDFPTLYKSHVFSSLIDPEIYFDKMGVELNFKKVRRAKVNFGTVIFPLSASNGEPYYYLFVPFFDNYKKVERERERLGVITLGLFVLFAGLFIQLAFFLTKRWLLPLDVLSGQLKRIRLTEDPKPIEWKQDDEIGEVVGAYNMMISKLIESREALSISKQDEAWKEMAKQVAHEIKNPLTPMRLRIQQVLSQLSKNKEKNKDLLRYLEDALRNIDLVDETAKSFQGFASLPEPKNKDLDLGELLRQVTSPFSAHPQAEIMFEIRESSLPYFADPKILGGAFLNLILNGLQSVPDGRKPMMFVKVEPNEKGYLISFEDNGTGVSKELREKIFEPHYTTKKSGSGLGLQIVKRGIQVYKGEIIVDESRFGGARFSITLPT